jgi:glutathione S-transferase
MRRDQIATGFGSHSGEKTLMLATYPLTAIVVILSLLVYIWVAMRVGKARAKYGVHAPVVDGPVEFQRVFRVHMNTLEQLVIFLPALAIFAAAWGDQGAAIVGIFWPVGRILYAVKYYEAAEKRGPGFGISFLSAVVLLLGGLVGAVMHVVDTM